MIPSINTTAAALRGYNHAKAYTSRNTASSQNFTDMQNKMTEITGVWIIIRSFICWMGWMDRENS